MLCEKITLCKENNAKLTVTVIQKVQLHRFLNFALSKNNILYTPPQKPKTMITLPITISIFNGIAMSFVHVLKYSVQDNVLRYTIVTQVNVHIPRNYIYIIRSFVFCIIMSICLQYSYFYQQMHIILRIFYFNEIYKALFFLSDRNDIIFSS